MPGKASFAQLTDVAPLNREWFVPSALRSSDFDWGFDLECPFDQLSLFARHIDTAAPIARLPVFALADFDLTTTSRRQLGLTAAAGPALPLVPLGLVGTDHVGYASFDLWILRHFSVLEGIRQALAAAGMPQKGKPRPVVALTRLRVLPFQDPMIAFDAVAEGDLAPDYITLRMDFDEAMLAGRADWPPMPAMQTPGLLDCRLSPGSFSMAGALLIGEDGCETLLPGNLASRLVRFSQLLRTPETATASSAVALRIARPDLSGPVRLGYRVEYASEWFPLGHSLGQIAYSLPLAPAEKIKVAVVDWTRRDVAKRTEQSSEAEDLQHAALRDRSLSEAVNMVVRESQSGSSFMAGGALSAGAGIPLGPVSLGIGAAFGIGGASAKSQGMRSVAADTTQKISDAFHQSSSAMRELNSTVVIQGEQAERSEARTRVVVNHNHSHAMTILYYEVLQHYRIVTRPAKIRPVLFLKYEAEGFGDEETAYALIERYRRTIAANLLDESVRGCIDTVVKRQCLKQNLEREVARRAVLGDPLDDLLVGDITMVMRTGISAPTSNVIIDLVTSTGGQRVNCVFDLILTPYDPNGMNDFSHVLANFPGWRRPGAPAASGLSTFWILPHAEYVITARPKFPVRWKNLAAIEIAQTVAPANRVSGAQDWIIENIRATTSSGPHQWIMHDGKPSLNVASLTRWAHVPVAGFKPPIENVDDLLNNEELCCLRRLLDHLDQHRGHYWRAIWLAETATDRAVRLDGWELNGTPLLDLVDNELLGFDGEYAIMPAAAGAETDLSGAFGIPGLAEIQLPPNQFAEQILTLPARGVFAEAKLGHCNASELIDPTRFWDWQQSPIPEDAPEIAPASTDSRAQDPTKGLAATAFPAAMVNIVNPQGLPDPVGLNAASGLLSALGPFRDMSGMKELGPFLQTLSNNATQLASQGMKNAQAPALMNAIRAAPELTPETKAKLIEEVLTGQAKAPPGPPPPQASPPAGVPPASGTPPGSSAPPATPATPTPAPAPGPGPAPVPAPAPGPGPKAVPAPAQRTPTIGPKSHRIEFAFNFAKGQVMMGRWNVTLISGREEKQQSILENTVVGASGVAVGNRMIIDLPAGFGGGGPVIIQINGTIVGLPQSLSAGSRTYATKAWAATVEPISEEFTRAEFDKAQLFRVVQPVDEVSFSVKRTITDKSAVTKTHDESAGLKVGVENGVEIGGTIGVAEAKEAIKIDIEGTYGWSTSTADLKEVTGGFEENVEFKGYRVSPLPPTISAK